MDSKRKKTVGRHALPENWLYKTVNVIRKNLDLYNTVAFDVGAFYFLFVPGKKKVTKKNSLPTFRERKIFESVE